MKTNEDSTEHAENKRDLYFGPFVLKPIERTLWRDGAIVPLTPKEFEILRVLVEGSGQHFSSEALLKLVWQDTTVDLNNVSQHILGLRRKMGKDPVGRDYVLNSPGVGYVFAAAVSDKPPSHDAQAVSQQLAPDSLAGNAFPDTIRPNDTLPVEQSPEELSGTQPVVEHPWVPSAHVPEAPRIVSTERIFKVPRSLHLYIAVVVIALPMIVFFLQGRPRALLATQYIRLTDDGLPKLGPLLCNGTRLWFQESLNGEWRIVSVLTTGGDVVPFDIPLKNVVLLDIAADGSALLVSGRDETGSRVWAWPLSGGDPQLLPAMTGQAGWAPDKRTIAFGDYGALFMVSGSSTSMPIIVPADRRIANPRWAPDGARLSFTMTNLKSSLQTIWLCDRSGKGMHPVPLSRGTGEDQTSGTWTRNGRYYLFVAGSAVRHDIWAVPGTDSFLNSHFGHASRLTNGSENWNAVTSGSTTNELYAIGESVTAQLFRLTPEGVWHPYLGGTSAYELDFSRDGKLVTYTRYPDHTIWKARSDGTERIQLTYPGMDAHQPHWSPDGSEIAFMAQRPGNRWRVMTINTNTGVIDEPIPEGEDQGVPTWSSDGRLIVYGEWKYSKGQENMQIHLWDRLKRESTTMEGSQGLWTPRWSPDGAYISALRQDSKALMLKRSGSLQWWQIVEGEGLDDPTWSVDSKYVYLTKSHEKVLRVRVIDGRVEQYGEIRDFPFPHETWFGVAPDGSPLGLRARRQEIYSLKWAPP